MATPEVSWDFCVFYPIYILLVNSQYLSSQNPSKLSNNNPASMIPSRTLDI